MTCFLLCHIETAGFNDALDFRGGDATIVVQVQAVEGLIDVEAWLALETLSYGLGCNFCLKVDSPHIAELHLSVGVEAVVAAVERVAVIAWPSVQHV